MYYVNCFFIYSILGYFFELLVAFLFHHKLSSGILYGPITPIYGIGVVTILIVSHYLFMNLHLPRWRETIITFFILIVILTIMEFLGGFIIEKIFHITFWNYEKLYFHIGKYISLEISFLWGFLAIFLIYVINPLLKSFILNIPHYITYIAVLALIFDCIFTYIKLKG